MHCSSMVLTIIRIFPLIVDDTESDGNQCYNCLCQDPMILALKILEWSLTVLEINLKLV